MLSNVEKWIGEETKKANRDIQSEATRTIYRWIEAEMDKKTNISDIEKELDKLEDINLQIEGYKHIVRLLGRRIFIKESR